MEMTPERKSAQDADSLSALEKLRKHRSAFPHSHRPGGHPKDLNPGGGPNQMIKSGPDRVDKTILSTSEAFNTNRRAPISRMAKTNPRTVQP